MYGICEKICQNAIYFSQSLIHVWTTVPKLWADYHSHNGQSFVLTMMQSHAQVIFSL